MTSPRTALLRPMLALAVLAVAGCGGGSRGGEGGAAAAGPASELRLGYFANVTHAAPVYGVATGGYQKALGSTKLSTQVFNAGPAAVEALFAGSLDAAYLGPSPAVNAFVKSRGDAVRIVAGATAGGAALVVKPAITKPEELKGKKIADPQTGGTQDVALRTYLAGKGFTEDAQGGGDVTIAAQENAQTLDLFKAGSIDGAWVPEPWASRLVLEGGGRVLVDERSLWPGGRFITTNLLVRRAFLVQHPDTVTALLRGQLAADAAIRADPVAARTAINAQLQALTGKPLAPAVLSRAFAQIQVGEDPLAATLKASAEHAFATGLVKKADLKGIYDLRLLHSLTKRTYDDAGLGSSG